MVGREINELYLHELLRTFGMTLIGVFIPIYILSQGFSLLHAGLFIVLSGFTGILLSYPLARVVARLGFRHSIAASYLLVIPGILLIRSLPLSLSLIVASSLLYNTGRVMHNVARNAEFATDSHHESRSRESGRMLSIPNIARVIAPLLGGTVFAVLGFTELVGLSILILLLSLLPLLRSADHTSAFDYSFRSLALEDHWRALPLFTIRGIQAVTAVSVFGLFVYHHIGGAMDVGAARALDSLGFVATGLVAGRLVERYGSVPVLLAGTLVAGTMHALRGFLVTPVQAFLLSLVAGIFFQIYHVPLFAWFADRAEEHDSLEFYTLRKILVSLGNVITITTLAMGIILLPQKQAFMATFGVAAVSTVAMGLWYWRVAEDTRSTAGNQIASDDTIEHRDTA